MVDGLLLWNNHVELPGGMILIVGPIGMVTSNMRSNLQNLLAVLRLHRLAIVRPLEQTRMRARERIGVGVVSLS